MIDDAARAAYLAREPVQRRPPDAAGLRGGGRRDARRLARARRAARSRSPRSGGSRRTTPAPTASTRTREGLAASVEASRTGAARSCRTSARTPGPKEGRLRLLRATRTQLEPIFLLYDADPLAERPDREPDLDVDEGGVRTHVWRLPPQELEVDVPLLIADGHHRYETARRLPRGGSDRRRTRSPCSSRRARRASRSSRRTASRARSTPSRRASRPSSWDQLVARALPRRRATSALDSTDDELDVAGGRALRAGGRHVHAVRATRRSQPSTAARPRPRSSCGRRRSSRCGVRASAARRCRRRRRTSIPKLTSGLLSSPRLLTRLARALPRRGRGRAGGARATARPRRARAPVGARRWAATTRPRSTRPPRRRRSSTSTATDVHDRLGGDRRSGATAATRVVVDPIDGSLNAKRGIPYFCLSSPSPTATRWATSSSATSTTSARARSGRRRAARARS